ncbi:hypothetical protein ACHAWO_011199 [Cyclotella atomus]|uniref:Actin n=1 Tax=Cyclotella atomus TaxID=382360 RepID=A0ABD3NUM0_9STRA
MYCGDETGAVIGDIGSHTSRFGYGGEDCPKVVIPSAAYRHHPTNRSDGKRQKVNQSKYTAPVSLLNLPPDDCFDDDMQQVGFVPIYSLNSNNIHHKPIHDTVDTEAYTALWEYSFHALSVRGRNKHTVGHHHESSSASSTDANNNTTIDHPILSSINPHHGTKHHAQLLEILFESLSTPAAYLCPGATLSSFAFGRQSALVVDIGHSGTTVTPVMDGYTLKFGSVVSDRGGEWLGRCQGRILSCRDLWRDNAPCQEIVPRYITRACKEDNNDQLLHKLKLAKESSFHQWTVHQVMYEMMTGSHVLPLEERGSSLVESLFHTNTTIKNENHGMMEEDDMEEEGQVYVLPDGTRVDVGLSKTGKDLCHLPELLFAESLPECLQSNDTNTTQSPSSLPLHKLVQHSLSQILDTDIRKELLSNIILTGSSSLFPGIDKRLSAELSTLLPNVYKNRVICSKNSVENRYSTWIGGSILSSLGSFQQMWLSRREYEECGAVLGLQKFH